MLCNRFQAEDCQVILVLGFRYSGCIHLLLSKFSHLMEYFTFHNAIVVFSSNNLLAQMRPYFDIPLCVRKIWYSEQILCRLLLEKFFLSGGRNLLFLFVHLHYREWVSIIYLYFYRHLIWLSKLMLTLLVGLQRFLGSPLYNWSHL